MISLSNILPLLVLSPIAVSAFSLPTFIRCGGRGFQGSSACPQGTTCRVRNELVSQCLAPFPTSTSTTPTCTVTDIAQVPSATANCTSILIKDLAVPTNTTLNLSKLKAGTTVTFSGKTTFAYTNWTNDLIDIGGANITVTSIEGAVIDGNGQAWWDGQGSNGGILKPDHFIGIKTTGTSKISHLHIQNWPTHLFSISSSSGTSYSDLFLDNTAGNAPNALSGGLAAAHNSDGFDMSNSFNMTISNSIVLNQDDCVAITSGNNVTVSNMLCDGGHGLSIGSIGGKSNNNVSNILFENSTVSNSQNGARIKTNSGTTGNVMNIEWRNILVSNISIYGIDVQQDYLNGGPTGIPTNVVLISNITMKNIFGTASGKQTTAKNYFILCGDGSCSDFSFDNIAIIGGTEDSCNFQPSGNFRCI